MAASRRGMESATERLSRLLTLVPWLSSRPGITFAEAAEGLGITEDQLRADLDLVFVCGYGALPDELIEVDADSEHIVVSNADTIARPLRLGVDEAITLMLGLRSVMDVPGLVPTEATQSALAKLEDAAGEAAAAASTLDVTISDDDVSGTLATIRRALEIRKRLRLTYLVPSRDETTRRDVDPMRLISTAGHWYLEAWCHQACDTRLFRLDRIQSVMILDEDGTPPEQAHPRDLAAGVMPALDEDSISVVLELLPGARWVADYYPGVTVTENQDDSWTAQLQTADTGWLRQLMLRLGGQARVLEPQTLAHEVSEAANQALANYLSDD